MKHRVSPPFRGDSRYKKWAKIVTGVDKTKTNGYAFAGNFCREGRDVEVEPGTIFLTFGETGSAKYHAPEVFVSRVTTEGKLEEILEADGRNWALDIRDDLADIMAQAAAPSAEEKAELHPVERVVALLKAHGCAVEVETLRKILAAENLAIVEEKVGE